MSFKNNVSHRKNIKLFDNQLILINKLNNFLAIKRR